MKYLIMLYPFYLFICFFSFFLPLQAGIFIPVALVLIVEGLLNFAGRTSSLSMGIYSTGWRWSKCSNRKSKSTRWCTISYGGGCLTDREWHLVGDLSSKRHRMMGCDILKCRLNYTDEISCSSDVDALSSFSVIA